MKTHLPFRSQTQIQRIFDMGFPVVKHIAESTQVCPTLLSIFYLGTRESVVVASLHSFFRFRVDDFFLNFHQIIFFQFLWKSPRHFFFFAIHISLPPISSMYLLCVRVNDSRILQNTMLRYIARTTLNVDVSPAKRKNHRFLSNAATLMMNPSSRSG